MIEKIDTNKIRGKYTEFDMDGKVLGGGDDTIDSIKLIAEKLNELVDAVNKLNEPVEMPPYNPNWKSDGSFIIPSGITQCGRCGYVFSGEHDCLLKDLVACDKNNQLNCQHESDRLVYTSNPPQNKCKLCGQFYR